MNARGRPQRAQRFIARTLNAGTRFDFAILLFFATLVLFFALVLIPRYAASGRANGMPMSSSSRNPSGSVRAEVTITTWSPRTRSTVS